MRCNERHAQLRGELATAPVGRAVLRLTSERVIKRPGFQACQIPAQRTARMSPIQSRQTLAREAGLPGRDETRVASQLIHDRLALSPVVEQQDQPRTSHLTYGHRATALHRHQFLALGFAQIHLVHAQLDQCNFNGSTY
jgi:hypothetical protein